MKKNKYNIIKRETVFDNPYRAVDKVRVHMPDGSEHDFWQTMVKDSVMVFSLTKDKQVILNDQYNILLELRGLELCAGFIDDGYTALTAVQRELREETGYVSDEWEEIGSMYVERWSSNKMTFFIAKNCERVGEQQLEKTEDIDVVLKSMDEVVTMLRNGTITNGPSVACMYRALDVLGVLHI